MIDRRFFWKKRISSAIDDYYGLLDTHDKPVGGTQKNHVSDPTAKTAIKHLEPISVIYIENKGHKIPIDKPDQWLYVLDEMYRLYSDTSEVGKLIRYRYDKLKSPQYVADVLNISKRTYHTWLNNFLTETALNLISMGLIQYDSEILRKSKKNEENQK